MPLPAPATYLQAGVYQLAEHSTPSPPLLFVLLLRLCFCSTSPQQPLLSASQLPEPKTRHNTTQPPKNPITLKHMLTSSVGATMSSSSEDGGDPSSELEFVLRPAEQSGQQQTSLFFTKLNYDIREQIYREVFGCTRIHIIASLIKMRDTIQRRWTHAICEEPEFCEPWDPCYPHAFDGGSPYMLEVNCLDINFLRTCKQAHKEGMGVIHQSNTFVFGEPLEYINFVQIFHPPIKSAHFGYRSIGWERAVPQLDLLTWALDVRAKPTKVKLSVYSDNMKSSQDGSRNMTPKALDRFLSIGLSNVTIKLPFMYEEIRELVEESGPEITFDFDPGSSEGHSLFDSKVESQEHSQNGFQQLSGPQSG